jgi:hypothetical protein
LLVEIVRKLAAYRRGRDGFDEPQTVGLCVVTETSVLEQLWARQQGCRIRMKALNEGFTGRQAVQAGPQLGERRILGCPSGWGEFEQALSPADETVQIHELCFGMHVGGR